MPGTSERYSRQLVLPGFDVAVQDKLKNATVAIVGCGGLGSPVMMYLAGAGIGRLILIDHDTISLSNLHRQVFYTVEDIGKSKAVVAATKLYQLNPECELILFKEEITSGNAVEILQHSDIIVDCTDNFPTRYLLNDAGAKLKLPVVYAAIHQYEGQVAVFNHDNDINYRDLHPEAPTEGSVQNCEEAGVLGTLAGIIGSMQANEVIKIITGIGDVLDGRILHYNSITNESVIFTLKKQETNPVRKKSSEKIQLIDYKEFCRTKSKNTQSTMNETTVEQLKEMMDSKEDFQLIDVREPYEFDEANLGGELIPMNTIPDNIGSISRDKKVVIHCKAGTRSANVINYLQAQHGFTNLSNLKGGIMAWMQQYGKPEF